MSLIIQTYNRFPSRILYVFKYILEFLLNVLSILAVYDKFYALKLISFGFLLHYFFIKKIKNKKKFKKKKKITSFLQVLFLHQNFQASSFFPEEGERGSVARCTHTVVMRMYRMQYF